MEKMNTLICLLFKVIIGAVLCKNQLLFVKLFKAENRSYWQPNPNQLKYTPEMKQDIHPTDYREVVIKDSNSDFAMLTKSSATTEETIKWEDGKEYPLITVHISSQSHPYYTGEEKVIDIEGRVDKFKARAEAAAKNKENAAAKAKKKLNRKESTTPEAQKIGQAQAQTPKKKKSEKPQPAKAKEN